MPNKTKLIIFSMALTLSSAMSSTAMANIYKWVDKNGTVHYTAHPPTKAEAKSEAKEFKVTKKRTSSLTHLGRSTSTVSENNKNSNAKRKSSGTSLDSAEGRAVHCKNIVNTQAFSEEKKKTEIAKCMRNLKKASPEDKKRAVETLKVMLE